MIASTDSDIHDLRILVDGKGKIVKVEKDALQRLLDDHHTMFQALRDRALLVVTPGPDQQGITPVNRAPTPERPAGTGAAPGAKKAPRTASGPRGTPQQVRVNSTNYRSVREAFKALGLPDAKHVKFRAELKKAGKLAFEGTLFEIVR